jgi:hypothetical protein
MKIKKNTFSTSVLELFFPSIANCKKLKIQKIQKLSSPKGHPRYYVCGPHLFGDQQVGTLFGAVIWRHIFKDLPMLDALLLEVHRRSKNLEAKIFFKHIKIYIFLHQKRQKILHFFTKTYSFFKNRHFKHRKTSIGIKNNHSIKN